MSKLVQFPNVREARREASEWVVRMDRGLTPEERAALQTWAAVARNRRVLREMATLWNDMNVLTSLATMFPLDEARPAPAAPRQPPGRTGRPLRWVAVAASVVLVTLGSVVWLRREARTPAEALAYGGAAPQQQTLETPVGESRQVALEDGSAVTLNTDTLVSVTFAPGHRDLVLTRGEAHFRVAHDANSPFRVRVGSRVVEAVGTAFSVRLRSSGQLEVMVTEGTVRVAGQDVAVSGTPQLVTAQHLLQVDGDGSLHLHDVEPVEMDIRLAWQRGMLIFQGEALPAVLAEFDRYTSQRLVIADPSLRGVRVGGYFRAGDVDALLIALRENFGIRSRRDAAGQILLTAAAN